jgi:tight adherence protein B
MIGATVLGEGSVPPSLLYGGLALMFTGVGTTAGILLSRMARQQSPEERIQHRLSPYGVQKQQRVGSDDLEHRRFLPDIAVIRSTVEMSSRAMRHRGLDTAIDARLETSGLPLRTGEWMLLLLATFTLTTLVFLLISGGRLAAALLGAILGGGAPWLFLVLQRSRRQRRFLAQLPDTLQLIAGSLQAGYSLQQAINTLVEEADPPISTEFRRALTEHSLGRPLEDALDEIGRRLESRDFSWVVMAIRVQHEVGGNLAELLTTVATTLRERDRLRRQVRALSAEGRLSGWILGALPVVFTVYLSLVRPDYLAPLVHTPLGWLMLATAAVLYAVGMIWISRVVRVEA